jgi:hypothetical protein
MDAPYRLHVTSPESDFFIDAQSGPQARALGARALRDDTLTEPLLVEVMAMERFRHEPGGGRREALFAIYRR